MGKFFIILRVFISFFFLAVYDYCPDYRTSYPSFEYPNPTPQLNG
jgi:hypothetical protein